MKDTKEPLLILLVLFVLIGLAYKPLKNTDLNNVAKNTFSSVGTTNKNASENIRSAEEEIKRLEASLKKQIEESRRSPYYGKITMSGVSGLYSSDPNQEYISLFTNLDQTETVRITGWYFKSEMTGYYAAIGKAALLPFPFSKVESDIALRRGDRVYITKGFSPIGVSFRTNKCTGFFEEDRTFAPSLPLQCPRPSDEKLPKFSDVNDRNDECIEILERIPRCTTKGSDFIRDLPDTVPSSCKTYIETQINYNSCVARHFGDTNFPGDEYHVYLNKFGPLWRQKREKINLHDQDGLIVDSISY